jgi:hypothetical protein
VRVIERRLEKANMRYAESLQVNKELREKMDLLRRERVIFD